jgi:peptidoglycan biosynthesis protein MviN/MurJ (putative lipid II flippase)
MASEYRKNEFIKWFLIPIIPYSIVGIFLYFFFGREQDTLGICFGISAILNLIVLVPIYIAVNRKVKERIQGIMLSAAVIGLLSYFTCYTALP